MGAVKKRGIQNEATRRYVEEIWAKNLRSEGFACPDEKLLCWYRIINKEIIHYLIFYTDSSRIPVDLKISFGACPVFVQPDYIRNVYTPGRPFRYGYAAEQWIREEKSNCFGCYSDSIWVQVPTTGKRGGLMLNETILPFLSAACTMEECYRAMKQIYVSPRNNPFAGALISATFVEMALYFQDKEIEALCDSTADRQIRIAEEWLQAQPKNQQDQKKLQQWTYLKEAINKTDYDAFLQTLEKRKQKNIKWLKKMGILA